MHSLLRAFTATGFLLGLLFMLDALLPKIVVTKDVSKVLRGEERGKHNSRALTHFKIMLDDGSRFPVFLDDYDYYRQLGPVEVSTSLILGQHSYIQHTNSGYGSIPSLLLCGTLFAPGGLPVWFSFWNEPGKQVNAVVFIIFLMGFVLFLVD